MGSLSLGEEMSVNYLNEYEIYTKGLTFIKQQV